MQKSPCINCASRALHCHGNCGAYKSWRKAKDQEREKQKIAKIYEAYAADAARLKIKR